MGLSDDLLGQPLERWDAEDFLDLVWEDYKDGWIDIPAKVGKYWVPWHVEWEGECGLRITNRLDASMKDDNENLYFSCGIFEARGRHDEDLKPPGWLWADLDEVHPSVGSKDGILPTLAWESSPGRYQAMWRLKKKLGLE